LNTLASKLTELGLSAAAEILQRAGFFGPLATREGMVAALRFYVDHDYGWFFRAVRIMAEHDPLDVSDLRLPTEVLVAMQDIITDPRLVEQFGRDLPGADIMLLNVSHFLPLEAPEEVLAALTRMVKRVEPADRQAQEGIGGNEMPADSTD
jgi:pimeloyl-ACP methyl ester carboxylesterase